MNEIKYIEWACGSHRRGGLILGGNLILLSAHHNYGHHSRAEIRKDSLGRKIVLLTCRSSCERQRHPVLPRYPLGANDPICWVLRPSRWCGYAPFRCMCGLHIGYIIRSSFIQTNPDDRYFLSTPTNLSYHPLSRSERNSLVLGYSSWWSFESTKIRESIWTEELYVWEPRKFGGRETWDWTLPWSVTNLTMVTGSLWQSLSSHPWVTASETPL